MIVNIENKDIMKKQFILHARTLTNIVCRVRNANDPRYSKIGRTKAMFSNNKIKNFSITLYETQNFQLNIAVKIRETRQANTEMHNKRTPFARRTTEKTIAEETSKSPSILETRVSAAITMSNRLNNLSATLVLCNRRKYEVFNGYLSPPM